MRPSELNPLFADINTLEGIGPRLSQLIEKLLNRQNETNGCRTIDLIWHMPTGVIDRRQRPKISEATAGMLATLKVQIKSHQAPHRASRAPYRITCEDESGEIDLIFFRADPSYLKKHLPVGETRYVSGRIEHYSDHLQMPHPDHIVSEEELETLPLFEPIYPLTAGISGKILRKAILRSLEGLPDFPEWQDEAWLKKQGWPTFSQAIGRVHTPENEQDLSTIGGVRQRLAYDEILANQLALALVRQNQRKMPGRALRSTGEIAKKITDCLAFSLTPSQHTALGEISDDLAAPHRMLRLLQGDVGSGKTIVALLAMAHAIEAGTQATLMVPTEVLARQHLQTLMPYCEAAGLRLALLTGREKGRPRQALLEALSSGEIDILIGTHALFQEDVIFCDLAFAVIDEQHRFGVYQRLALQGKGGVSSADILVMTATPIPRTLLLTHYGDMKVSRLTEKPAGREPITTVQMSLNRLDDVLAGLSREQGKGTQIYWVCPLVESSEKIDLAAAEERSAHLKQLFPGQVGLIHGQMAGKEKDAVMAAFQAREIAILVATTVIEVGVDIANASIMIIEHAERFGLAQLHQLRGRVGRGEKKSSCVLLYHPPLTENARARLEIMRQTEDGFLIAEEDLRLRGGGELLGTRQSGLPEFRTANVPGFENLLQTARDDAKLILERDPELTSPRGEALKTVLYLFECDEAVRLLRAG